MILIVISKLNIFLLPKQFLLPKKIVLNTKPRNLFIKQAVKLNLEKNINFININSNMRKVAKLGKLNAISN